jgi:hypothetical protein
MMPQTREELEERVVELEAVFEHIHEAGDDDDLDRCAKCGLDIRDRIHKRLPR